MWHARRSGRSGVRVVRQRSPFRPGRRVEVFATGPTVLGADACQDWLFGAPVGPL